MNTITIELCAEDRARLDAILKALENRPNCEHCVSAAMDMSKAAQAEIDAAKAEAKDTTPTNITPEAETPTETPAEHPLDAAPIEVDEPKAEEPPVDPAELRRKVIELSNAGKKDAVKEVVMAYAPNVSDLLKLPHDKIAEAYAKLCALEG